jgi:hypothetical protein
MRASLLASAIASMLRCSRFDACSIQGHRPRLAVVCTENLIRVADVMESPKLAE